MKVTLAKMAASVCVAGVIILTNLPLLAAYESHVAGVDAKIINDKVIISPPGGKVCNDGKLEISIKTILAGSVIYYTMDGTMPECGKNGNIYSTPFKNSGIYTIKAISCHNGKRSAAASGAFEVSASYCQSFSKIDETYLDSNTKHEEEKKDIPGDVVNLDNILRESNENNQGPEQKGGDGGKSEGSINMGGIQAKPEDAPADALTGSDIKDDDEDRPDGSGGGASQQTLENTENSKEISDNTKEIVETVEKEAMGAKLPTIDNSQKLTPLKTVYVSDLDADTDNGTEVVASAAQSSEDAGAPNLPIAPDGDGTLIEFSLNS